MRFPNSPAKAFRRLPLLCALAVVAGCGHKIAPKPELVPVTGRVTLGGTPLTSGMVMYHPDLANGNTSKPVGMCAIREDGTYEVITQGEKGAPVGWYRVTVSVDMAPPAAGGGGARIVPIDPKYGDQATTKLSIEVRKDAAPASYDLKLER